MMIHNVSLIVHDLGVFIQPVEYHAVSMPVNADVFADLLVVGVIVEHLLLYVLRWALDLIMYGHVHLA